MLKKILNLILITGILAQFLFVLVPQPVSAEYNNSSGLKRGDADTFERDQGSGFVSLIDYIFGGLKYFYRTLVFAALIIGGIIVIVSRWRHNAKVEADSMDGLVYIGMSVVAVIAVSFAIDWLFKHFF